MPIKVKLPTMTCPHCGHEWKPRKLTLYICPTCKRSLDRPAKNSKQASE